MINNHLFYGGVTKVETQNLASPKQKCIYTHDVIAVPVLRLVASPKQKCAYIHVVTAVPVFRRVARETQDFASLLDGAGGDDEVTGHCINMRKRLSDDE